MKRIYIIQALNNGPYTVVINGHVQGTPEPITFSTIELAQEYVNVAAKWCGLDIRRGAQGCC